LLKLVSLDAFECCTIAERCNGIRNEIGDHEAKGSKGKGAYLPEQACSLTTMVTGTHQRIGSDHDID